MNSVMIFEVCDVTDDMSYYTVGVYSSLEGALGAIDQPTPPETYNCLWENDVITFEVRRRPLNQHSERGGKVAVRTWTRDPVGDDDDEDSWTMHTDILVTGL